MASVSTNFLRTRSLSKDEIKLGWAGCISIGFFLVLSGVSFYVGFTTKDKGENPATLLIYGFIFLSLCIGSICYLILRLHEKQGVRIQSFRENNKDLQTLLLPYSRTLQNCLLIGLLTLALSFTLVLRFGDLGNELANKIIVAAALWIFFVYLFFSRFGKPPGIYIVPKGIYWATLFGPRCFAPWESVHECNLFIAERKKSRNRLENYLLSKLPNRNFSFGISLDIKQVQASNSVLKRLAKSAAKNRFQLVVEREGLAVPLPLANAIVNCYMTDPAKRREIGSVEGLGRIKQLADQTGSSLDSALLS